MIRTQLYIKVEFVHEEAREGQRISTEVARAIKKIFGVRNVEIQNSMSEDLAVEEEE